MKFVLGTAQLCRTYGVVERLSKPNSIDEAVNLLSRAKEMGISIVDTASSYGDAELAIGLSAIEFEIHTKIDPFLHVEESIEKSLLRLRKEQLDVVYLHNPNVLFDSKDKTIEKLAKFRGSLIRKIGISIYSEDELTAALNTRIFDVVQVPFNLFDRRFESRNLSKFSLDDLEIFARSIFLQGLILMKPANYPKVNKDLEKFGQLLSEVCASYGISNLEAAVGFAKSQRSFSGAIFGSNVLSDMEEVLHTFNDFSVHSELLADLCALPVPDWSLVDPRNWRI